MSASLLRMDSSFQTVSRQGFRRYFQPSRIVLAVIPAPETTTGFNIITLCFQMYCSYKPPMMAVAIQDVARSYALIQAAGEFVLAVPGPSLLRETMFCGMNSSREVDKIAHLDLEMSPSERVAVPGVRAAIANVELTLASANPTGDHVLAVGQVQRFSVQHNSTEPPLLSLGPDTRGYRVLAHERIHRVGIALRGDESDSLIGPSPSIVRERGHELLQPLPDYL